MGILSLPKEGIRDDVRGIVDGADQGEPGGASLQPVVPAGVELEQHAFLGVAVTSAAMLGRAAGARTGEAGLQEDAAERGARHLDALAFREQLAQMLVVTVGVGRLGQGEDPLPHLGRQRMRGRPSTVAMDQGGSTRVAIPRSQAVDLPDRYSH